MELGAHLGEPALVFLLLRLSPVLLQLRSNDSELLRGLAKHNLLALLLRVEICGDRAQFTILLPFFLELRLRFL